jgi:DNA-binding PadR family transcriptional regulator
MELESRMCQGRLTRHQAAILWLIESEVGGDGWMRRRVIEQHLNDWFATSNSQVSQILREMARPPLSMVVQMENPASGREKVVALTPEGKAFFESMIEAGLAYFAATLSHVNHDEMRWGIKFLGMAFGPPAVDDKGQRNTPLLKSPPGRLGR